jgi:hypothetical protein
MMFGAIPRWLRVRHEFKPCALPFRGSRCAEMKADPDMPRAVAIDLDKSLAA